MKGDGSVVTWGERSIVEAIPDAGEVRFAMVVCFRMVSATYDSFRCQSRKTAPSSRGVTNAVEAIQTQ